MHRTFLIAGFFGMAGTLVVMLYTINSWQAPYLPLLYALVGVAPMAVAGVLADVVDEFRPLRNWRTDRDIQTGVLAALVASTLVPAMWMIPHVRGAALQAWDEPDVSIRALYIDPSRMLRTEACHNLMDNPGSRIERLEQMLADAPDIATPCLSSAVEDPAIAERARTLSYKVALRWHTYLVGDGLMDEQLACQLTDAIQALPLLEEQRTTTYFDCAINGATASAVGCCLGELEADEGLICERLPQRLNPPRMAEWGSLGFYLGMSWGEPEVSEAFAHVSSQVETTCPASQRFALMAACDAIVTDTLPAADRPIFEWLMNQNTSCMSEDQRLEGVSAIELCDRLYDALDAGASFSEADICLARRDVARENIEARKMAIKTARERKRSRHALAGAVARGAGAVGRRQSDQSALLEALQKGHISEDCYTANAKVLTMQMIAQEWDEGAPLTDPKEMREAIEQSRAEMLEAFSDEALREPFAEQSGEQSEEAEYFRDALAGFDDEERAREDDEEFQEFLDDFEDDVARRVETAEAQKKIEEYECRTGRRKNCLPEDRPPELDTRGRRPCL